MLIPFDTGRPQERLPLRQAALRAHLSLENAFKDVRGETDFFLGAKCDQGQWGGTLSLDGTPLRKS